MNNTLLQQIMQAVAQRTLQNNPAFGMFQQMMQGKTEEQQIQTLMNLAKSKGIADTKLFSEEDLKTLGIKKK